jgi:hypothetical protein
MLLKEISPVYTKNEKNPTYKMQSYWLLKKVVHILTAGLKVLSSLHLM